VSHKDYLVILRDLNRARGEDIKLISEIQQTKQEIIEEQNKLQELKSEMREKSMKELVEMTDDLLETRHKIEKLEDTLQRMSVRSPLAGIVKGLQVAPGNVTQPGGLLLEVVPFNQPYMVESRVNPRDIGHIKVGDPVTVKLLTYDFARYGSIKGKLTKISASTFVDPATNKPYYTATTTLDQQFLGSKSNAHHLMAGMTVEASIITGEKTLLEYLLKPIHRSTDHAFRER
jgi:HlyD family type I secretion membrane fusion protein